MDAVEAGEFFGAGLSQDVGTAVQAALAFLLYPWLRDAALAIAREAGIPVLPRGGGTSQCGQTVNRALVIDTSKHLNRVLSVEGDRAWVEPGIVLDELNRQLKPTGLWFPVDVSTSSRATIGGMTGNNSCGTRSIRYGIMRDNVVSIDALLADGTKATFGETSPSPRLPGERAEDLVRDLLALGEREAAHIKTAFPDVSRRVGGYLIDALLPPPPGRNQPINLATLLCGSEGTLAISRRIRLKLSPQPKNKALGICHFATFRKAMEAPQHIVKLGPVAVEVVDSTLIGLARDIAMFRPVMDAYVRGRPDALLLVEFAEDDQAENLRRLDRLAELMGDLGHPDSVVKVTDAAGQKAVWDVRASGLNIMMSMKTEGKPVSFIEDCAVPLEHLADYAADVQARSRSRKHVALVRNRIARLCDQCGWKRLADVNADSFGMWRSRQTTLSPKTLNEYLTLTQAFLTWLEKRGRSTPEVRDRITVGLVTDATLKPAGAYDLVICREVLEHLTVRQVMQAVSNMVRMSSKISLIAAHTSSFVTRTTSSTVVFAISKVSSPTSRTATPSAKIPT